MRPAHSTAKAAFWVSKWPRSRPASAHSAPLTLLTVCLVGAAAEAALFYRAGFVGAWALQATRVPRALRLYAPGAASVRYAAGF